jgi:hypothetical protein
MDYLTTVIAFLTEIKRQIESQPALALAYRMCPQISEPSIIGRLVGATAAATQKRYLEVAAVWSAVLVSPTPELDDDFFIMGGDSLQLINLVVQLSALYGQDFDYEQFFKTPTMATLMKILG